MKNLIKQMTILSSIILSVFILTACSHDKSHHNNHMQHDKQMMSHDKHMMMKKMNADDAEYATADIYSKNAAGKSVKIGTVKMHDKNDGVMLTFDISDMRVGVPYELQFAEYECKTKQMKDCEVEWIDADTPTLMADSKGVLKKELWVDDVEVEDLAYNKIVFTRDNGVKAAWGFIKPYKM